jgi:hypothetical protein
MGPRFSRNEVTEADGNRRTAAQGPDIHEAGAPGRRAVPGARSAPGLTWISPNTVHIVM